MIDGGALLGFLTAMAIGCPDAVPWYEGGRPVAEVCPAAAVAAGLTVVDLGDDWAPAIFEGVPYRETFAALANERFGRGAAWDLPRADASFELYGIPPSFGVIAGRLRDADPACSGTAGGVKARLACAHLLTGPIRGERLDDRAIDALRRFQRKNRIFPTRAVDDVTAAALALDERELVFRAALRALRERVVDATGLLEDGSARNDWGTILGRTLDAPAYRDPDGWPALASGAPDLVSPATEAAARALGWTDPDALAAFLARPLPARVALRLPPPPAYHHAHMELRADIDRGDVWTGWRDRDRKPAHHAMLTLIADDGSGHEIALIRWPTTIGGWERQRLGSGAIAWRFKPSPVGDFIWRQLMAAPVWLPPPSTPDDELARGAHPDESALGPGYRSAFGLVALTHETAAGDDDGIRSHGSASYASITAGHSHGCHRLHNHLALRLGGFLLRHRQHVWQGRVATEWRRWIRGSRVIRHERGWLWELDPPVPIRVLPGALNPQPPTTALARRR
jgi:hypothetical protein